MKKILYISLFLILSSCGLKYSYYKNTIIDTKGSDTYIFNGDLKTGIATYSAKNIYIEKNKISKSLMKKFSDWKEFFPKEHLNVLFTSESTGVWEVIDVAFYIKELDKSFSTPIRTDSLYPNDIMIYLKINKKDSNTLVQNYIPLKNKKGFLAIYRLMSENTHRHIKNINFLDTIQSRNSIWH